MGLTCSCGNTDFSATAKFCKKCGLKIENTCTNVNCKQINDLDAAYCTQCGSETLFNKLGTVKPNCPF